MWVEEGERAGGGDERRVRKARLAVWEGGGRESAFVLKHKVDTAQVLFSAIQSSPHIKYRETKS